jgi:hypothetical protein
MSQSVSPERPSSSSAAASHESRITTKKEDLPPPRSKEDRGVRSDVKNPLEQVRLTTFIHVLIYFLLVILAWYTYRTTLVAVDAFRSRGGAFSFPSTSASSSFSAYADPIWQSISRRVSWGSRGYPRFPGFLRHPYADVERRVEELADALGVRPLDLANAIADAVHQLVPTETLASLASEAKKTGGGRIMDALRGEYAHGVHIADGVRGRMG